MINQTAKKILKALSFDGVEVEAFRHMADLKRLDPMKIFYKKVDEKIYNGSHAVPIRIFFPSEKSFREIEEIGEGRLIMGDGASYHNVVFNAIFFKPEQQEVIDGEVIEIAEFGAFVRIGPMDGLVHVSQVTDDYINYDSKRGALLAKESNKTLDEGDLVRTRIVAISLKDNSTKNTKIGLTMRQNNLGRFEWIEEAKNKNKKAKS